MTHHARLNIIMLVTIVGLLVFVYFKPQTENVREYTIAAQSARAIHTVRIVGQQREIVLHQQDNHWYLTEHLHIRANEKKIKDILKILTANSNYRFPLKDLARYMGMRQEIEHAIRPHRSGDTGPGRGSTA